MNRVVTVLACAGTPYTCSGFDPADWEGGPPDFTLLREWEQRAGKRKDGSPPQVR